MQNKKSKRCRVCGAMFFPFSSLAKTCGVPCAIKYTRQESAKKEKSTTREAKAVFNQQDTKWLAKKAQEICNRYVRLRDEGRPCISCRTVKPGTQYASGHFIPVSRCAALRFDERNIHLQCNQYCNMKLSGNLLEYEKNLRVLLGIEIVEWLKGPHAPVRYRAEDYRRIIDEYRGKIKALKAEREDKDNV